MGPIDEQSRVIFDEEAGSVQSFTSEPPALHRWIIRHSGGVINDSRHANYALIALVVISIIASFLAYPKRDSGNLAPTERTFLKQGGSPQSYDATLFPQ